MRTIMPDWCTVNDGHCESNLSRLGDSFVSWEGNGDGLQFVQAGEPVYFASKKWSIRDLAFPGIL